MIEGDLMLDWQHSKDRKKSGKFSCDMPRYLPITVNSHKSAESVGKCPKNARREGHMRQEPVQKEESYGGGGRLNILSLSVSKCV